jgi:Malic enzyme
VRGELPDALDGADVFIGVSAANVLPVEALARMAPKAVVFPMANPTPEVDPVRARQHAAVVASGRSDLPNQINNVLAFPGVFRGLLDARAREISDGMLLAAAEAIARVVTDDQLNANYIIPSVFDPAVTQAVAAAVADQARQEPARPPRSPRTATSSAEVPAGPATAGRCPPRPVPTPPARRCRPRRAPSRPRRSRWGPTARRPGPAPAPTDGSRPPAAGPAGSRSCPGSSPAGASAPTAVGSIVGADRSSGQPHPMGDGATGSSAG